MQWLQARFPEVSSEPTNEESEQSEIADLKAEIMKNKKTIKSMNKLLRTLAVTIDPTIKLPEETEDQWEADCLDDGQKENEQQTDDIGVELGTEKKNP